MLSEGDVIEIEVGHKVYAEVPKHFLYSNCKGDFERARGDIRVGGELEYFAGKYIVIKTTNDGGSGHPHSPNGHHVHCIRADDSSVKIDFYQTGGFTAVIADIEPIGKATLTWTIDG